MHGGHALRLPWRLHLGTGGRGRGRPKMRTNEYQEAVHDQIDTPGEPGGSFPVDPVAEERPVRGSSEARLLSSRAARSPSALLHGSPGVGIPLRAPARPAAALAAPREDRARYRSARARHGPAVVGEAR